MTGDLITIDKNAYNSLQQELIELRQREIRNNLKHSQEQISLFIEYTPAAIAIFDCQMRYLLVSRRWREDYGLGDENIIGRSHYEVFPNLPQNWREIHQRCLLGAVEKCDEDTFLRIDGKNEWLKWEIHPWYKDSEEVSGIIMFTEVITTRKQTELALANYERRFQDIAANVPGAIFQFTMRNHVWVVDYMSDFIWELAGITAEEITKDVNKFLERIHPEDFKTCIASVVDVVENPHPWHYEGRLVKPNGEIIWWKGDSTPIRNEQGEIIFCGVLLNITEIKQKEAELQQLNEELEARVEERTAALLQAEARWQRLADNVPGMLYEFRRDVDGIMSFPFVSSGCQKILGLQVDGIMSFPFVSSGCQKILGLQPEDIKKDAALGFQNIHSEDFPGFQSAVLDSAQTLQNFEYEWRTLTGSGDYKWIKAISRPERQSGGETIWYGCFVDIHARKQAEQKLEEQAQFLQSIWEGVDYGIFVLEVLNQGEEFRYIKINPTMLRISPMPLDLFPGKIMAEALPAEMADVYRHYYRECVQSRKSIFFEESFSVNGQETWWLLNVTPLLNSASQVHQLVVTVTDITERKQAERDRQMFVALVENCSDLIGCASLEGQSLFVNEAGLKLVGIENPEDVQQFQIIDYLVPEDREDMQQRILPIVMEHGLWQGEYRLRNFQTGEAIPADFNIFLVKNSDTGEAWCLASVTRDIRERKQAEIKLQQQTENLENTLYQLQNTQKC
ncbi:PAS domain S-box protein [Nodularia chucula]|uniref:PAS domain S-box protein n=1 Tax=Nodularia chucula TaxID=3093667 RepID=UPI0039C720A3